MATISHKGHVYGSIDAVSDCERLAEGKMVNGKVSTI